MVVSITIAGCRLLSCGHSILANAALTTCFCCHLCCCCTVVFENLSLQLPLAILVPVILVAASSLFTRCCCSRTVLSVLSWCPLFLLAAPLPSNATFLLLPPQSLPVDCYSFENFAFRLLCFCCYCSCCYRRCNIHCALLNGCC